MKLKNILLLALLAIMVSFSACVEETLLQPTERGQSTTLDITFSSEEVVTKADYEYATAPETKINSLAVALFEVSGNTVGDFLDFAYQTFGDDAGEDDPLHTGRKMYSLTGLKGIFGDVQVVALANTTWSETDLKEHFKAGCSYATAKAAILEKVKEENDLYVFESDNLVKFADVKKTIGADRTLHVEMTQLAARVDVYIDFENAKASDPWTYEVTGYSVGGINVESQAFLKEYGDNYTYNTKVNNVGTVASASDFSPVTIISTEEVAAKKIFSFYTYERETSETDFVEIKVTGNLTESNADFTESKTYKMALNPQKVSGSTTKTTDGLIHGYYYKSTGKIDVKNKTINFDYEILDWIDIRLTEVDIIPIHYLQVRDVYISLPNDSNTMTIYQSSSNVSITDVTVYKWTVSGYTEIDKDRVDVTFTGEKDGNINIFTPLPDNFVPRKITFTVRNLNGLTRDVTVIQYPPLYVTSHTTTGTPSGGNGQDNKAMYMINSLVADYSKLPYPDDRNYTKNSWSNGVTFTNYLRDNAIMGYPLTDNGKTIDTGENNYRISPRFMLASQCGVNDRASYTTRQSFCDTYSETDSNTGKTYSDWRMPTLAEVYLIDVLQNIKACEVKKILEGSYYWSARSSETILFMDWYVDNSGSSTTGSVRCVRDVKDDEVTAEI
ncbi:hypothetical protein M2137_002138 [Parabacteroides sp. PFB2-10]|uniref:fimbrial tip adhesin FimD n=1 Tax=Parabacteroides sp. PFB2-10 TaxID=1742405 RepID=UPI0024742265|nr:fimbrial protein [Parabacteroides sp. PFB2-10]MDH6313348.1 hypothetical protein [Parabacteroides sp. PFB2-10]MDL2244594.1 DUF1566 domain-containing protein [Parabacteroides sp. OttesenSCG-928-J18]